MFPLSHIYVATKVTGRKNDLLVLGSIIPDLAWFSIPLRDAVHNTPQEFWQFVQNRFPLDLDLALGVKLHSQVNHGADFYSDDLKTGYAKVKGRKILKEVKRVLQIEGSDHALVLAHNFIEAALDLNIQETDPRINMIYAQALNDQSLSRVAEIVGKFLSQPAELVLAEIKKLVYIDSPRNLSSPELLIDNAFLPWLEAEEKKKFNRGEILNLLTRSQDLIRPTFLEFFEEVITKLKKDQTILVS